LENPDDRLEGREVADARELDQGAEPRLVQPSGWCLL
jgi:hypothetical protein